MSRTVVGLLDDRDEAESVVSELVDAGFDRNDISLLATDAKGEYVREIDAGETGSGALAGAGVGAAFGGIGGLLVGMAGLAIPGIGALVAAGPIAAALAGAGVGAAAGGVIGALANLGVPREEAEYYAEGIRRGGVLVTVNAPDDRAEVAEDVLRNHSSVNIQERAAAWREQGWSGFDETASPYSDEELAGERARSIGAERLASEDEARRATERSYIGRGETMAEQTAQPHLRASEDEAARGTASPHDFNYRGETPAEQRAHSGEDSYVEPRRMERPIEGEDPMRRYEVNKSSGTLSPVVPEPIGSETSSDKTIRNRDIDPSDEQAMTSQIRTSQDERIAQQSGGDEQTIGEKLRDTKGGIEKAGRELGEELGFGTLSQGRRYTGVERRKNTGTVYTGVERRVA